MPDTEKEAMPDSERFSAWMKEKGFSTNSLAEAMNESYSTIWFIANGERPASDGFKWRFALTFGYEEATRLFDQPPAANHQPPKANHQ